MAHLESVSDRLSSTDCQASSSDTRYSAHFSGSKDFDAHSKSQCNSGNKNQLNIAPGYVREQIPRLSAFISLLVFHVWKSKTLSETLDIRNRNQFLIAFVQNILEITKIPLPVVTLAVKYIQRLRRLRGSTPSLPGEETRIFSVALILAQKYSDDTPYGNRMWGKVLGLSTTELTRLEIKFLTLCGYNLYVGEQEYTSFCRGIQALAREWNASLIAIDPKSQTGMGWGPSGIPNIEATSPCKESLKYAAEYSLQTPTSSRESLSAESDPETSRLTEPVSPQEPSRYVKSAKIPVVMLSPKSIDHKGFCAPVMTLEDYSNATPKAYGLILPSLPSSIGGSPALGTSAHLVLSPVVVTNTIRGAAPSFFLVATPQFVVGGRNQFLNVVTGQSLPSPNNTDEARDPRSLKRAKHK